MTIAEIKTVCFVGAGTMGCFNSLVAALSGYAVVIYDVAEKSLEQVPERHRELATFLVGSGYCSSDALPVALRRISTTTDLAKATAAADLVSESVFERLDLKRQIHQQLDDCCPDNTILTTNTSALLVSDIEDAVQRGDRFAALHSHLGAPLVDIVGGPRTSAETIEILRQYVLSIRGIPLVLKKENPGYVLNAMLVPLLTTAMVLVIDGLATIEQVDRAWMVNRRAPMGPFGMIDLFGLDLIFDSWAHRPSDKDTNDLKPRITAFLDPYLARGDLGMKSGKGFYSYPDPAYADSAFVGVEDDVTIAHIALTSALLQNALLLAANGVAEPEQIDRAWMAATTLGTGPFGILDQIGVDEFAGSLATQASLLPPESAARVRSYLEACIARDVLGEKTGHGFYTYPGPLYRDPEFVRGLE